jgi:hypothetical protein
MCYLYQAASANFSIARARCMALGGDLALYDSADKQLAVEVYFERQHSLTQMYYWIGVRRPNISSGYELLDGRPLPPQPSESPYAHWNWYQPIAAARSDYSCVMAYNAYRLVACHHGGHARRHAGMTTHSCRGHEAFTLPHY